MTTSNTMQNIWMLKLILVIRLIQEKKIGNIFWWMWEVVIRILGGFNNCWKILILSKSRIIVKVKCWAKSKSSGLAGSLGLYPPQSFNYVRRSPLSSYYFLYRLLGKLCQQGSHNRCLLESSGGPPHEQQPGILGLGNMSTLQTYANLFIWFILFG